MLKIFKCKKCKKQSHALKENIVNHYLKDHSRNCLVCLARDLGIPNPYFETKDDLAKLLAEKSVMTNE